SGKSNDIKLPPTEIICFLSSAEIPMTGTMALKRLTVFPFFASGSCANFFSSCGQNITFSTSFSERPSNKRCTAVSVPPHSAGLNLRSTCATRSVAGTIRNVGTSWVPFRSRNSRVANIVRLCNNHGFVLIFFHQFLFFRRNDFFVRLKIILSLRFALTQPIQRCDRAEKNMKRQKDLRLVINPFRNALQENSNRAEENSHAKTARGIGHSWKKKFCANLEPAQPDDSKK